MNAGRTILALLALGALTGVAARVGVAAQTCANARASHHVAAGFSMRACVVWNTIHDEDRDS